jgi:hypothetical protein
MANRTTHRGKAGKKLYAVRAKSGRFKDIQTYKRAHGQVHSKETDEILSRIKEKYGLNVTLKVGMPLSFLAKAREMSEDNQEEKVVRLQK